MIEIMRHLSPTDPHLLQAKLAPPGLSLPSPPRTLRPFWRRLAFVGPVIGLPVLATALAAVLTTGVDDILRVPLLLLLLANLAYVAVTGWPGILGALARLTSPSPAQPAGLAPAQPNRTSRTAVLFPIYNEDPHPVFAAVEVMARALSGYELDRIDIYVLSDTQDLAIAATEQACYLGLPATIAMPIYYRRRAVNSRRKAGNIADFCENWGPGYDYMVVLDADSLMTASSVATMIGLMDANPRTGIVQSVPYPVGRETLFARAQQFSARLYTPLLVEGLSFWQQGDGNYWGHNAIIRIAPFMAHCDLPVLPGRAPFGGEILCHDVVEAALMQRGGWDVWLLPSLEGSYESLPANMVDYAQRERRWCQGNLQHTGVLDAPGLRPVGRYHLAHGVLNYLSGPLLIALAGLAAVDGLTGGGTVLALLDTPGWAHWTLLTLVMGLMYGSKLCALAAVLLDAEASAGYGGRTRLVASALLEQVGAMVSAPVLMAFYTRFIVMMLLGRSVRWDAQPRDDRGVSWSEAWRCMRFPTLLAAIWLAILLPAGGTPLLWAAALLPGLLVAAPVAVWTSRATLGAAARRMGLFLTPDEVSPTPILRAYQRAVARPRADGDATGTRPSLPPARNARMQKQRLRPTRQPAEQE